MDRSFRSTLGPFVVPGIILFSLLFSFAASAQEQWQFYSYPKDGFSISSPVEPEVDVDEVSTEAGPVSISTYEGELSGSTLAVYVSDFSKVKPGASSQTLAKAEQNAISSTKGHLIRRKKVVLNGYQGVEFESENDTTHFFSRVYMAGHILYQEIVTYPVADPYRGAKRFLDSIHLIPRARG